MATITKRVNSAGEISWQAKCRRKGFPARSATFGEKKAATIWAREIERKWDSGVDVTPAQAPVERKTVRDILVMYDERCVPSHKSAADESARISRFLQHPFSNVHIDELTPATLASYRDERLKKVKPGTVLKELNIIRAAINRARIDWGIAVPDVRISRPRTPAARDRVLKEEEEAPLLEAARASTSVYLAPAISFALETAMRQGEILALRRADIDWTRRVAKLHDTKNGCARNVPLSSRAIAILEALPKGTERMFDVRDLSHLFIKAVRAAKIPHIRFHDLRHTACSRLARKGLSTVQLQAVSGHKTLAMLSKYVHLTATDVVALLD